MTTIAAGSRRNRRFAVGMLAMAFLFAVPSSSQADSPVVESAIKRGALYIQRQQPS